MNNEPQDIEKLLKIILAFSEGIADTETIDKVRSLAGKLKENPSYNQVKALEYTIRTIFDKIYENCPGPKLNYKIEKTGIILEDGYFIFYNSDTEIQIHKAKRCFVKYFFDKGNTQQALRNYIGQKLVDGTFVLKEFIANMNRLGQEKLTYNHIKRIVFADEPELEIEEQE